MTKTPGQRWIKHRYIAAILALAISLLPAGHTYAQSSEEFNIQVSPSPMVVTLTPGKSQVAVLTVRNLSTHPETLVPELSGFHLDAKTNQVKLDQSPPANMGQWASFNRASLSLAPGATGTLDITYNTPSDVGFSYTAAITLSRAKDVSAQPGANLKAKVVVFNLVNIDRSDAKRELSITSLKASKGTYEFLPAKFELTIQNKGNVIDQPNGSLFLQRSFDSTDPIATIAVNKLGGYILPNSSRTFELEWAAGFPAYSTDKQGKNSLNWDWRNANQLRIGKYNAKAVVVYSDGQRDVPLTASVDFWVIPWRLLGILLLILIILAMGLFGWGKILASSTKKVNKYVRRKK
jgi:hypothetical protein